MAPWENINDYDTILFEKKWTIINLGTSNLAMVSHTYALYPTPAGEARVIAPQKKVEKIPNFGEKIDGYH